MNTATSTVPARFTFAPGTFARGAAAVAAARAGAPLYVLNPQTGWIRADVATLARAERLIAEGASHATWIYGA
jgi:hypothetical protein